VCDTLCVLGRDRALFAKNSDRPPQEAQVVEWHDRRAPTSGLRTQYLTLPDPGAHAFLASRPTWLWGVEHGVNEHGVAVGNEKIWTVDDPRSLPPALLGMDLVRLALERATTADDALDVITTLLERHGQGGSGEPGVDKPYFSSFLLADARTAWIIETSARTWAARHVHDGAAISNRVTLARDWTYASDDVAPGDDFDAWRAPRVPTAIADHRLTATRATVARGADDLDARAVVATLRHHGDGAWGHPGDGAAVSRLPDGPGDDGRGVTVCMHVRGDQATTASMVAELTSDRARAPRAWVCLGSPCASVYVPVFPPAIPPELGDPAQWERFARLRDRVERDTDALIDVRDQLAPVEADLWDEADVLAETGDRGPVDAFTTRAWKPIEAALARLAV
jgi:hypothetical protein